MDTFVYIITNLGSEVFYTIALPIIYWVWSKEKGYRLGLVFLSSLFLNSYLKFLFAVPRPPATPSVRVIHPETGGGYAFPSGHAQGSTTFWGWLAVEVRKKWFYWLAVIIVVIVSMSRIYLNVHWPSDVLGGIGIGLFMLAFWSLIFKLYHKDKVPVGIRVTAMFALPIGMYLLHSGETDLLAGVLLGMPLGRFLEEKLVGWREKTSWQKNVLKVLAGMVGFLVIRYGLKALLPNSGFFNVLRYAVVGLWVSFIAPWVFKRMGWEDIYVTE